MEFIPNNHRMQKRFLKIFLGGVVRPTTAIAFEVERCCFNDTDDTDDTDDIDEHDTDVHVQYSAMQICCLLEQNTFQSIT